MSISIRAPARRVNAPARSPLQGRRSTPALLLLPTFAALVAVSVYPILRTLWLSLRNTSLATQSDRFIGPGNFHRLIADTQFWNAWQQTLSFTVISTSFETVLGLGIALVLTERFPARGFVRAAVLVPWAVPTVVTSRMFGWLFDGQSGLINYLLVHAGLIHANINWTGSQAHAMQTIILADVWKTTPFMALLLLAGLQVIPHSLVEAAHVDGAGPFRTFVSIRLPLLMPALLTAALLRALDAFRIFDIVYTLTGGGPADSTETMSTLTYKRLFSGLELGYGSALSTAMFLTECLIAAGFFIFIARQARTAGR